MKKNIVFLSNLPCLWDSMRTVYESFIKDQNFNVYLVAENHNFFLKKNIQSINNNNGTFDLNRINPHVIFREVPYCDQLPNNFKLNSLIHLRSVPKICYIPYGSDFCPPVPISKFFFGHPFLEYCWKVFIPTSKNKEAYRHFYSDDIVNEKFVISGIPKLDIYLEDKEFVSDPTWRLNKKDVPESKRIIWTVHSSVSHAVYEDNTIQNNYSKGFSTFLKYKDYIPKIAKKYQNLDIVLRPHPSLFYNLLTLNYMKRQELDDYINNICSLKNANIFPTLEQDYFDLFFSSDALISDFSSTLSEYLPTKKPILFLQREDAPDIGSWYKNAKHFYHAYNENEIEEFIETIIFNSQDKLFDERVKILNEYLYTPKGGAGNFIKEYVVNELDKERSKFFPAYPNENSHENDKFGVFNFKKLLGAMQINSVIDLGCGNNSIFFSEFLFPKIDYTGLDIDAELIMEKRNWFSSFPNMKFEVLDIIENQLPCGDAIVCSNILSFLTEHQTWRLLHNIVKSKSKYLFINQSLLVQKKENLMSLDNHFYLPKPLLRHPYSHNTDLICWDIENLSYYIPHLATGDASLRKFKTSVINRILALLEEIKNGFVARFDLFIKVIQSFSDSCESHNELMNSKDIMKIANNKLYKIIIAFFYITYGTEMKNEIKEVFPEVEDINFDTTKTILKDVLYHYVQNTK